MTITQIREWAREHGVDEAALVARCRAAIGRSGSSWQAVQLVDEGDEFYLPYGYRKYTTGQYVPKAYLRKFGWKNTYYQRATLRVRGV